MDRHRFVQQYVERQRAYLPTYTAEHVVNERIGTPSKPPRSDAFGFDTPVLRPRVPVKGTSPSQLTSKSRTHGVNVNQDPPPTPGKAPSETRDPDAKRRKASTPIDTDNERAARLADRRERKRKKRAIVNPPQKHDDSVTGKKGRTNGRKAKKPAGLALLYGFSATNVTKDRLTLKPAPSLGVFSKGKASTKKKVSATNRSSLRKEIFSESAFLNQLSERAADRSKVDDESDESSVSNDAAPRANCAIQRDRGKCTETTAMKTPPRGPTAESEVWDIELQSKLPSSARDVSSELGASDSGPVVLGLRGAEWTAPLGEREACRNNTRTRSLSITGSRTRSDLRNEVGLDAPSIHPSHSASQVGRRAADMQPCDLRQVTSKYFAEPEPIMEQPFAGDSGETYKSNDGFDTGNPDQDVQDAAPDSLISVAQPMAAFGTWYEVAPLEFPSDCSPYDDGYAHQGTGWDMDCASAGLASDDVEQVSMEYSEGYDPFAPGDEPVSVDGYDQWPWQDLGLFEDEGEGGVAEFLEGRALLLGVPEWPRGGGVSGLAQAEMDVARRLRDHWRPLRLS